MSDGQRSIPGLRAVPAYECRGGPGLRPICRSCRCEERDDEEVKEVLALVALSEKSEVHSLRTVRGATSARGARACPGERAAGSSSRRAPRRP